MGLLSSIFSTRSPSAPFHDRSLNRHYQRDGYAVIPLAGRNETDRLSVLHERTSQHGSKGFHTTHFSDDRVLKRTVHEGICEVLAPLLAPVLNDYTPVFGNFMVKEADGDSPVPMHADWTYVDEHRHIGVSVWLPLVDADERNGCLCVIPGSHRLSHHIRGPRIPQWDVPCNFELIDALGKTLPLRAGEAVVYDHRLLHYSDTNMSGAARPAVNLSLVPKGVPMFHYAIPEGETEIHAFAVEHPDFFVEYDNFQMPDSGKTLWKRPNDCPLIDIRYKRFIFSERLKGNWSGLFSGFRAGRHHQA